MLNSGETEIVKEEQPEKDKNFFFGKLIPSIFNTKERVDDLTEYSPWLVNKTLSFRLDCITEANEMNRYSFLPKDMQYEYLLNKIKPKKRFSKWVKKEKNEEIEIFMQRYQCNERMAKELISLLPPETIKQIMRDHKAKE